MNAISDWLGEHWEQFKADIAKVPEAAAPTVHFSKHAPARDLTAIGFSPQPDPVKEGAWSSFLTWGGRQLGRVGQTFAPVFDIPILGEAVDLDMFLLKNAVNRPIATAMLAGDTADRSKDPFGTFTSFDNWRKAWNDSANVTAGQAVTYNAAQLFGMIDASDSRYDPRLSKDKYEHDWFFKTASGGLDLSLALFADPARGFGKLGGLAKTRYLNKAVTSSKAIKAGQLETHAFGSQAQVGQTLDEAGGTLQPVYAKLYDQYQKLPEPVARRRYYNQDAYGGVVSTALSAAAKAGDKATFADIHMAIQGSYPAQIRLYNKPGGAAFLDALSRSRNPFNTANVVRKSADDEFAHAQTEAMQQSAFSAWMDQTSRGPTEAADALPQYGTVANLGSVRFGKGMPVVNPLLDAMKDGFHNFGQGSYTPVQFSGWNTQWAIAKGVQGLRHAVRITDRNRGYESHIDVNFMGSHRQFRTNLERAGDYLDESRRNWYVTAYGAAVGAEERSTIAFKADNEVIGNIAARYGMTVDDVKRLELDASRRRQSFRQQLNTQQKYLPKEFLKRVDELLAAGANVEAAQVKKLADEYNRLMKEQKVPESVYFTVDERGRLNIVPIVPDKEPILTSHVADRVPMMDYRKFERSLQRFAKPRRDIEKFESDQARVVNGEEPLHNISERDYKNAKILKGFNDVRSTVEDVYQALNYAWSVAAVLRPGQTLRMLGDDGSRSLMMLGMVPTIVNGGQGLSRIGQRLIKSGMTKMQDRQLARALKSALGRSHHQIDVADNPLPPSYLHPPSESAGFYNYIDPDIDVAPVQLGDTRHYDSLESALLDGQIHLDTYIRYVAWAARQGRIPHDLESLVEEAGAGLRGYNAKAQRSIGIDAATFMLDKAGKISNYKPSAVRELAIHALTRGGKAAFANPLWQEDLARALNGLTERGRGKGGLIADPFSADANLLADGAAISDYEFLNHGYVTPNPRTKMVDDYDAIYDFVAGNLPRLLTGHHMLHAKWASDGRVRLSIVRQKKMPQTPAQRMNAAEKEAQLRGLKARGSNGLRMVDGHGAVVIPGALAGTRGGYARSAVSADSPPYAMQQAARNAERANQWSKRVSRDDILPFKDDAEGVRIPNPDYDPAYEKYVNQQIANDEVARMFLRGRSDSQVLQWLDSGDPKALRYLNEKPKNGLTLDQQVQVVQRLVDHHLPPFAGQELRDKALRQEITGKDLREVVPDDLLPNVNGEVVETSLRTHPVIKWAQKKLDSWFHRWQNLPTDYLIRFPFYDTKYRQYFEPMYDNYIKNRPGLSVSQDEIERLGHVATQRAIGDVKDYLYDSAFRTDLADALSSFMPFSNAIADSMFKWTKIIRERPLDAIANYNLIYRAPERMGLVYDQDGNKLVIDENGQEVWHSVIDDSVLPNGMKHDRYVAFQVPSWIKPFTGGLTLASFNKTSMTTAIFDPSVQVGPLIAYPANRFALSEPEFGDNEFIKTFVLPYGPSGDQTKTLLPGLIRSVYTFLNEDSTKADSATMAIMQTQYTNIRKQGRNDAPNLDEAKRQAWYERFLRLATSAVSPVSFQYQTPYQPYIDAFSQMLRKHGGDGDAAMTEFRTRYGDEYNYLTARVTKSNIALPSTLAGYHAFKEKQDAIAKFPEMAGLITGADGAGSFAKSQADWEKDQRFSKSAYEWEKRQTYDETGKPIRQVQNISDAFTEVERQTGWQDYMKQNALMQNDLWRRGLTSINASGAEDIKAAFAGWIKTKAFSQGANGEWNISPWFEDFRKTDGAAMDKRIADMQQILYLYPKWMQGRDDLQGLATYLEQRQQMQKTMDYYGYATLAAKKATWLQDVWQSQIFDLKQRNPAFGQLYDRWLTKDPLSAEGITAAQLMAEVGGGQVGGD